MENSNAGIIEKDSYLTAQINKLSHKINLLLETVFNQSTDGMMLLDYQGVILLCNSLTHTMFTTKPSPGISLEALFAGSNGNELQNVLNRLQFACLTENEASESMQISVINAEEKRIILHIFITATRIGDETFFIVRLKDITLEKRNEIEMSLLAHAMMSIGEGLSIIDLDGKIIFANEAFYNIFGYPLNSLNSTNINGLCHEDNPNIFTERVIPESIKNNWEGEIACHKKDGRYFPYYISTSSIKDDKDQPFLIICVGRDITENKNLEAQLQQAHKMEAIGQLAGGVAHDFNNLLIVISGYTDRLISHLEGSPLVKAAREIDKAAKRASALTGQLLAYSRKQILKPELFDLNNLIHDLYKMLSKLIGENINLKTDLHEAPLYILADQHQIGQVIMNLCVNARDAMPEGGDLTIRSFLAEKEELKCSTLELQNYSNQYVGISVQDTGCGMDEETRNKIFDPFFTTKPKDKGTGLGLSTVYGIVKQSDGGITLESTLNLGTTFYIYFPLQSQEIMETETTTADESKGKSTVHGHETILVVEDEEAVRELVCEMLENYGYNILYALNGVQATEVYSQHASEVDLILTDVVMPEMGGKKLIESLPNMRPDVKVLYMSGYTDSAIDDQGILNPNTEFIQKPFSPADLLNKVRSILDR